jgi:sugar lactone lactonase YvrE
MDGKSEVVATECDGEEFLFPNGMAFNENGLLYVAVFGRGDVTGLGRNGGVTERVRTSRILPTNAAFTLPGHHRIHVTEYQHGQVETFFVNGDGLPLWNGLKSDRGHAFS